jgi:hypothetical protein
MRFVPLIIVLLFSVIARAAEKPNIIVIYADDMGYGDCTINNPNPKITSNIDRLTNELRIKASAKAGRVLTHEHREGRKAKQKQALVEGL